MLEQTDNGFAHKTNLAGGWNIGFSNYALGDDEFYDVQNGRYDVNGWLTKRRGRTTFGASQSATLPILGMGRLYRANGNAFTLFAYGTTIARISDNGATITNLNTAMTSGNTTRFITANDSMIILNGADVPRQWDGTTFQNLGGTPPVLAYAVFEDEALYGAGDPLALSRVYYTTTGTISTWPVANTLDFSTNDGSNITGLASSQGTKFIFKGNSIYSLTGNSPNTFIRSPISKSIGLIAPGSLGLTETKDVRGAFFFMGRERDRIGVYVLLNGTITHISQPIDPILNGTRTEFSALNQAALSAVVGYSSFPFYELLIPTGSATTPSLSLVYDMRYYRWTKYVSRPFSCIIAWSGTQDSGQIFAGDAVTGQLYQLEQGYQDNGVNVDFQVRTKWYDWGSKRKVKAMKSLFFPQEGISLIPSTAVFAYDTDYLKTWANTITYPSANGWSMLANTPQFNEASLYFRDNSSNACTFDQFEIEAYVQSERIR